MNSPYLIIDRAGTPHMVVAVKTEIGGNCRRDGKRRRSRMNNKNEYMCPICGEDYFEKADYALFCLHKSLKSISPALGRISRLCGLLRVSEKDGKNTLPRIITHNESRMALNHITLVKRDVDDAYQEILSIFENTGEPGGEGEGRQ